MRTAIQFCEALVLNNHGNLQGDSRCRNCKEKLANDSIRFQHLRHPPYSSDFGPLDIRMFLEVKSHLRGQRFRRRQNLVTETMKIESSFDEQFYLDIY